MEILHTQSDDSRYRVKIFVISVRPPKGGKEVTVIPGGVRPEGHEPRVKTSVTGRVLPLKCEPGPSVRVTSSGG